MTSKLKEKILKLKHLIFDLDGTLIDSSDSIKKSLIEACKINNIKPITPISEIKIGPPLDEMIYSISPYQDSSLVSLIKESFITLYDSKFCIECVIYPGAINAIIKASEDVDLFLVTNKRINPTLKILRHFNISEYFKAVIGCDTYESNGLSKGKAINRLVNEYALSKTNCSYFGDTKGDEVACQEAGIDFFYVPWGYGDLGEITNLKFSTLNHWDELDNFIKSTKLT